jgi:hypothetical protein
MVSIYRKQFLIIIYKGINIAFKYTGSGKNLAWMALFRVDDVQVFW